MVREGVVGLPAEEIDRAVADEEKGGRRPRPLGHRRGGTRGRRRSRLAQQLEGLDRVPVEQGQLDSGVRPRPRRGRLGHDRAHTDALAASRTRRPAGRPGPRARTAASTRPTISAARWASSRPPGVRRMPRPTRWTSCGAGGGLQTGQMVAHRRLPSRAARERPRHRPVPRDGGHDAEMDQVEHLSRISMGCARLGFGRHVRSVRNSSHADFSPVGGLPDRLLRLIQVPARACLHAGPGSHRVAARGPALGGRPRAGLAWPKHCWSRSDSARSSRPTPRRTRRQARGRGVRRVAQRPGDPPPWRRADSP